MSLKSYMFLLFLYTCQTADASENNHFCFVINPSFNLEVTKSKLDWGKWIAGWGNYEDANEPSPGDVINADDKRTICSSGREGSATGTEGFVEFKDEHNKRITVKWNNPWGPGTEYARIESDDNDFYVSTMAKDGKWYLEYSIDYVWPNTPRLIENVDYTIPGFHNYFDSCLRNSCTKDSRLLRRDDSDDDSFCDSSDKTADQGITIADLRTVDNDARRFEQDYPPIQVPYDAQQPNPVYKYSAVYFPAFDLRLPIVVRASVNLDTVKAAGKRKSNGMGHMIGVTWVFGGPNAPQTESLNLQYKRMENNARRFVKDHPEGWVDMTVVIYYFQNTVMPVAFGVNLVYHFARGVVASNCQDIMFWNEKPYPPNPPAIG